MTPGQHRGGRVDDGLPELGRQFLRQRARAKRAWRMYLATSEKIDPATSVKAHQAWSDAVDDALRTVEAMSVQRPHDLDDLLLLYEALWWWIKEDDNVLDGGTRRWLGRFGRHLRRLVRGG